MTNVQKHIVIFSHGFGVEKDALGLFTDISQMLSKHNIESIMFDYNDLHKETKEVHVKPFSEQTKILQKIIDKTCEENPDAIIDMIGHSQGSVMIAKANTQQIRKVVSIAPFFHTEMQAVLERHKKLPGSQINLEGVSKRVRSNGTTTIIPASYWSERFSTDVYKLYNELSSKVELTIINAGEDEIMTGLDLLKVFNTHLLNIHGDHDFKKHEDRIRLIKAIEKILV